MINNKISEKFKDLKNKKEIALIIGTVPGYPDLKTSFDIIKTIKEGGADILELSASFSDPVADGPTLAQAHQKFLIQRISKNKMFKFYKKIQQFDMPVFIIEYANIVYKTGQNKYFTKLRKSGIGNIIIPDVSLEEGETFKSAAKNYINQSLIISPNNSFGRIKKIAESSKDFVYAVSVTGVTGERRSVSSKTVKFLKKVSTNIDLPIVVGFGISKPEQIKIFKSCGVSGVVICSAVVNLINRNLSNKVKMIKELKNYISNLKKATKL